MSLIEALLTRARSGRQRARGRYGLLLTGIAVLLVTAIVSLGHVAG